MTVALSAAISAAAAPGSTSCARGCDATALALSGVYLGQSAVVVLAVLAITGEYHTGLIAVTLAAVPRRLTVFAAKATVVTATVLLAGSPAVAGSLLAGRILLPGNGFTAALSVADGPTLRTAAGTVLSLALVALLSFGLAAAVRHTATALTVVFGLLYLASILANLVTVEPWHTRIERLAPMTAGPGVLAAYAGAALVLGAVVFTIRDP